MCRSTLTRQGLSAALLAALATGGLAAVPMPVAAAAGAAPPVTPSCAWERQVTADTSNVFYPDSAASYWVLRFTVQEGLRIKLSGRYPDSRYASFNVYKAGGGSFTSNGVGSSLPDYRINPDTGHANPWQRQAEPGGGYTVTARHDAAPGQSNVLPLAPEGTPAGRGGSIVLRVYLPAGGDFSAVTLPSVTFERDGVSRPVPLCSRRETAASTSRSAKASTMKGKTARTRAEESGFARQAREGRGGFPNADSAYLAAVVGPPAGGDVLVVRGKAPRHAPGSHPTPWPAPERDVRYWSMCTNLSRPPFPVVVNRLPGGGTDYGCRADDQTKLDDSGFYTYVIGTEAQRTAIERIPGATFLPFSLASPAASHTVILRNMVTDPGFAQAIHNVPEDGNPASAARVMGAHYPTLKRCSVTDLATAGPEKCQPS